VESNDENNSSDDNDPDAPATLKALLPVILLLVIPF
jgi:hypothetical protein